MENQNQSQEQSFADLFEESLKDLDIEKNTIIKGTVVEIQDKGVMINVGFKSEGFVPLSEFKNKEGEIIVKPGDEVEVYVINKEDGFGRVRLSYRRAQWIKAWEKVKEFYKEDRVINGFVVKKINGGYEVDLKGVKAFLPASLADVKPVRDINFFVNRYYDFKIIKLDENNYNVVVDRKSLLEESLNRKREAIYNKIEEEGIVEGIIQFVRDDGAFIKLEGDIKGFIPAANISWGRVKSAKSFLRKGDTIKTKVLEVDKENNKVLLSIKHLTPNPWDNVEVKYKPGSKVKGKVVSIQDFGVFIQLEPGIEGLLHVSEMSWSKKRIHPSKIVQIGEIVEVMIKDLDKENRRVALSLKAILPTPWEIIVDKYKVGDKVKGIVKTITPFGLFIDIGEDEDGFIPKADISWTKKINDLRSIFKVGEEIEAVITEIDKDNKKFNLSIKHLEEDPYKKFADKYKIGDIVEVKVIRIEPFGVFVDLGNDIQGLIHISQLSTERVKEPESVVKEGDLIRAVLSKIDLENRKISLSRKDYLKLEEEKELAQYKDPDEPLAKIGDILKIGD